MRAVWVAVLIVESHNSDSRGSLISDPEQLAYTH